MSDLPSKAVNEFTLFHTATKLSSPRVIGIKIEALPEMEGPKECSLYYCEVKGDVADLLIEGHVSGDDNAPVMVHGVKIKKTINENTGRYYAFWNEHRKVHLPSMTMIGKPILWTECTACKKYPAAAIDQIVKKGSLTITRDQCRDCGFHFYVRRDWKLDQSIVLPKMDSIKANDNYVLFHKFTYDEYKSSKEEPNHIYHLVKWSKLEDGNFTGMGAPLQLPKEVSNIHKNHAQYLLNKQDQVCALWEDGSLIISDRFAKLETSDNLSWEWKWIFEVKSAKNRYLVAGYGSDDCFRQSKSEVRLIDNRGRVISSLEFKDFINPLEDVRMIGSSTLIANFSDTSIVSAVTVRGNRLKLIAENVKVFDGSFKLYFNYGPSSDKRQLCSRGYSLKLSSIKLKYR